jgi:fatty acid desaturase
MQSTPRDQNQLDRATVAPLQDASLDADDTIERDERWTTIIPGILIATLVPAAIWMGIIWAVAGVFGWTVPLMTLLGIGAAIALFLTFICGAIMMRG